MTVEKEKRNRFGLKTGLVIFVLIILISAGLYLYAGWLGYQESPKRVEVDVPATSKPESYTLSSDQESSLLSYGYPEGFTILFYEEETPSQGIQTVRLETWDYYTKGTGLTFINGELTAEDPLKISEIGPIDPLPYSPDQFKAYMSLDEAISVTGIDTYIEIPVEDEFIEDGVLYFANSLSFGLKDDQLMYIEAIALTNQ
jgi:hypothetical protein